MSVQIQIKRGLQADVASLTLREGEQCSTDLCDNRRS